MFFDRLKHEQKPRITAAALKHGNKDINEVNILFHIVHSIITCLWVMTGKINTYLE